MEALKHKIKKRLEDALLLLCVTDLQFKAELKFEGLIGITLDEQEMMMVTIKETVKRGNNNTVSLSPDASHSSAGISVETGELFQPATQRSFDVALNLTTSALLTQHLVSNGSDGVQVHSHAKDCVPVRPRPGYLAGSTSLATLSDILQTAKKRSAGVTLDTEPGAKLCRLATEPEELSAEGAVEVKEEPVVEWTDDKEEVEAVESLESDYEDLSNKTSLIKLVKIPKLQSTAKVKKALAQMEGNRAEFLAWVNSQFGKFSTVMSLERKELIIEYLTGGSLECAPSLNMTRFVSMVREKGYQRVEHPHNGATELALPCRLASGQLVLKLVAAKEEFFDVIARTHLLIEHAGSKRTFRKVYESYCLVPKRAVLRFLQLCPYCKDRSFYRVATAKGDEDSGGSSGLPDSA